MWWYKDCKRTRTILRGSSRPRLRYIYIYCNSETRVVKPATRPLCRGRQSYTHLRVRFRKSFFCSSFLFISTRYRRPSTAETRRHARRPLRETSFDKFDDDDDEDHRPEITYYVPCAIINYTFSSMCARGIVVRYFPPIFVFYPYDTTIRSCLEHVPRLQRIIDV